MKIVVNGEEQDCAATSLMQVWELQSQANDVKSSRGIALALNGRVVHREKWQETPVVPGDRIEIVRAVAGG